MNKISLEICLRMDLIIRIQYIFYVDKRERFTIYLT